MKKKTGLLGLILGAVLLLSACGSANTAPDNSTTPQEQGSEPTKIVVGATAVPHAEMLNQIKDNLQEQGIELEVKEFADYQLINQALYDGELDANFFQHLPYMESYVQDSGNVIVSAGGVHIEPMGLYSQSITALDELKDGDKIGIPNDATNEGRALLLLEAEGLIKLDESAGITATPMDVVENSLNLQFVELDAAQLPRTLSEVTASVINTNYALEAELSPKEDAIVIEGEDSPYVNIIAVREGDENREDIKALYAALTTDEIREYITQNYEGVVPVF